MRMNRVDPRRHGFASRPRDRVDTPGIGRNAGRRTRMADSPVLVGLLWAFYPPWLLAGWLDFRCHRRTDLAHTSGVRESAYHLAMLVQVGAGLVAALALAPTHALLLGLVLLAVVHGLIAVADTRWADGRRRIGVLEQHVHGLLDVLPLLGLALYLVMHWPQPEQLAAADWSLRWRDPPLSATTWLLVLVPAALFAVWPGVAEFVRARRAATA
jgi:hypothetical protein